MIRSRSGENKTRFYWLAAVVISLSGWVVVGVMASAIDELKMSAEIAAKESAQWKRLAGKAYTEMLKASHDASKGNFLIPAGSRVDCEITKTDLSGKTNVSCNEKVVYPPADF